MQVSKYLSDAPGIQYEGVNAQDESPFTIQAFTGVYVGEFKHGMMGKPFPVTKDTIRARLGHQPENPHYQAVQDVLDLGISPVWVMRVKLAGVIPEPEPEPNPEISCDGASNSVSFDVMISRSDGYPGILNIDVVDGQSVELQGYQIDNFDFNLGNDFLISVTNINPYGDDLFAHLARVVITNLNVSEYKRLKLSALRGYIDFTRAPEYVQKSALEVDPITGAVHVDGASTNEFSKFNVCLATASLPQISCTGAIRAIGFSGWAEFLYDLPVTVKLIVDSQEISAVYPDSAVYIEDHNDSFKAFIAEYFGQYIYARTGNFLEFYLAGAAAQTVRFEITKEYGFEEIFSDHFNTVDGDTLYNPTAVVDGNKLTFCLAVEDSNPPVLLNGYTHELLNHVLHPTAMSACNALKVFVDTEPKSIKEISVTGSENNTLCNFFNDGGGLVTVAGLEYFDIDHEKLSLQNSDNDPLYSGQANNLTLTNSAGETIYQDED